MFNTGWSSTANRLTGGAWQRVNPPFIGGASGGTSAYFAKPSWQTGTPGTHRSVPDISALADPFTGFFVGWTAGGQYRSGPIGGTSLAAPIVASLAAVAQGKAGNGFVIGLAAPVLLLNDARRACENPGNLPEDSLRARARPPAAGTTSSPSRCSVR